MANVAMIVLISVMFAISTSLWACRVASDLIMLAYVLDGASNLRGWAASSTFVIASKLPMLKSGLDSVDMTNALSLLNVSKTALRALLELSGS